MHDIDLMLELQLQGKHSEARQISDNLDKLGFDRIPTNPGQSREDIWRRHCFNRGWFFLQDGDYQTGCHLLENGRFLNVYGSPPLQTGAPLFNPKIHNIKNKSIIISLEGGYGDEIIHARFATSYKNQGAKAVYLACSPELTSVFSRIEGVDKVILRNEAHTVPHDFWIPGFSAGWVAGHTFEKFPSKPYLHPLKESVDLWRSIVSSDKIKVGIRWAGNPKFEHQQFRRFPEEFLTNLSKYKELQLYSLQRDHNLTTLPKEINDLQHFLLSWEDTMAAIAHMDIVISSCTSVAHLAAAMGKETWVIVPALPYHTWTAGAPKSTSSPFYESVRIFRQTKKGAWNDTFQGLYKALESKFKLDYIVLPNEDRTIKRINLGSGQNKLEGFVNVDWDDTVFANQKVDLNLLPWPWKDNEYDHVVAKNVLQYLGNTNKEFAEIVKELYRISNNGAIWEISFPHWRSDAALDDLNSKHLVTLGMFDVFNRKTTIEKIACNEDCPLISFDSEIDVEIADVRFEYITSYQDKIKQNSISEDELIFALNHFNNVASSARVLIQVHKPPRYDKEDLKKAFNNK